MRHLIALLGTALAVGCGGPHSNPGPGLPTCTRPSGTTGCTATWAGSISGSGTCSPLVTQGSNGAGWTVWINGGGGSSTVLAGVSLPGAPSAGASYSMKQMVSADAKVSDTSAGEWEAALPQGDLMLQVDSIVQGSGYIHGTLAGSLAPNSGSSPPGVQLCVFL